MAPSTHPSDLWGWGSLPLANTWHHRALCLPLSECQLNAPQMCAKKSRSVIQLAHTFRVQTSSQLKKKTTKNATLRLSQIVICRKKRQKKTCLKRPSVSINKSKFLRATHRTEKRKIEIPRSVVAEALS